VAPTLIVALAEEVGHEETTEVIVGPAAVTVVVATDALPGTQFVLV